VGEGEGGLVQYYVKVVRLFEQVPAPMLVIKVAEEATRKVDQVDRGSLLSAPVRASYRPTEGVYTLSPAPMVGNLHLQ